MRRFAVPAVIAVFAVILLTVLAVGISDQGSNNSIAYSVVSRHYRQAPDYDRQMPVLTKSSATTRSLASYRGHFVLINVFASWCTDCQVEAKAIAQAQKVLAAHGGTVIGVPYQDSPSEALGFARLYGVRYPILQDSGGTLAHALNVEEIPDSYLIDPRGRIVALNTDYVTPAWVRATLMPAITEDL